MPFTGNNGPSILLAILTKDPDAAERRRRAHAKYPVPPTLDDVMEEALAKNPNIRTTSVGALADAVGHAYGLTGDHRQWATTPQQDLAREIAAALPQIMATTLAALAVAADPFAARDPFGAPAAAAGGATSLAEPWNARRGMDQAFGAVREAELLPMGVPAAKPSWLLPLIVGVVALLVGGAVTLAVMAH